MVWVSRRMARTKQIAKNKNPAVFLVIIFFFLKTGASIVNPPAQNHYPHLLRVDRAVGSPLEVSALTAAASIDEYDELAVFLQFAGFLKDVFKEGRPTASQIDIIPGEAADDIGIRKNAVMCSPSRPISPSHLQTRHN